MTATREEIYQRLLCPERDISHWLIPGDPYRSWDLDFKERYEQRFFVPGPWKIGETEAYEMALSGRGYRFRYKREKGTQSSLVKINLKPDQPWAVEIAFEAVDLAPSSLFGIVFGLNPEGPAHHVFLVSPRDKVFCVSKGVAGVYEHKALRLFTPAVADWHTTLRVDHHQGYWHYFVDEWLVYLHPAEMPPGLAFGPFIQNQATVEITRFLVQW